jgi:hypothetical protein
VIELQALRRPADPAGLERPLALPRVTRPDLALHGGGDVVRTGRARRRPGLLDDSLRLRVLLEQEVERDLEDVLGPAAWNRVRQGVARGVELLQEAPRDRHVQPMQLRRERLDDIRLRLDSVGPSAHQALVLRRPRKKVRSAFNRLNADLTCVRTCA